MGRQQFTGNSLSVNKTVTKESTKKKQRIWDQTEWKGLLKENSTLATYDTLNIWCFYIN